MLARCPEPLFSEVVLVPRTPGLKPAGGWPKDQNWTLEGPVLVLGSDPLSHVFLMSSVNFYFMIRVFSLTFSWNPNKTRFCWFCVFLCRIRDGAEKHGMILLGISVRKDRDRVPPGRMDIWDSFWWLDRNQALYRGQSSAGGPVTKTTLACRGKTHRRRCLDSDLNSSSEPEPELVRANSNIQQNNLVRKSRPALKTAAGRFHQSFMDRNVQKFCPFKRKYLVFRERSTLYEVEELLIWQGFLTSC